MPSTPCLEALRRYQDLLVNDEPELNSDYITFQSDCARYMASFLRFAGGKLPGLKTQSDDWDVEITHALFGDMSGYIRSGTTAKDFEKSSSATTVVAQLVRTIIAVYGVKHTEVASEMSGEHLPPNRRPELQPFVELGSSASQHEHVQDDDHVEQIFAE